ncbi:MAG TPA: cupin domain-containing protein [Chloroflexota bacterium]|nr:cupin domain-containing protein [Chloroflexota bacterium]
MSPSSVSIPAPNRPSVSLSTIHDAHGEPPWVHRLIENAQSYADLICEPPGSAAAPQWRPNADEFVVILEGRYEVEIEELGSFEAAEDAFICVPKGHASRFRVAGASPGVRVSIRQPTAQALPADRRRPAERRSAHSVIPTVLPGRDAPGGFAPNQPFLTLAQLKEARGPAPWTHRVIQNEVFQTNLIYAMPSPVPAGHWHSDCDEWWIIREGELEWVFDGLGTHRVKRGDFVCAPLGYLHRIHVVGDVPGIRMPTVLPNVPHPGPEVYGYARRGVPGFP